MATLRIRWPLTNVAVEVEWRDACYNGPWLTVAEHVEYSAVGPFRSIGYVLQQNDDIIQLVQSQSSLTGDLAGVITIPKQAVTKIRKLKGGLA